jgi:hypothetical protein
MPMLLTIMLDNLKIIYGMSDFGRLTLSIGNHALVTKTLLLAILILTSIVPKRYMLGVAIPGNFGQPAVLVVLVTLIKDQRSSHFSFFLSSIVDRFNDLNKVFL